METFFGSLNPSWIAWKIDATNSLRYVKITAESNISARELFIKNNTLFDAWVKDLDATLAGNSEDVDIFGVYILKDGSVYIGFEIPSEFTINYYFYAPVKPRQNLDITVKVYCYRMRLTDQFSIRFDEQQTSLVEYSNFDNDHPTKIRRVSLEIDRNLKLIEDWPIKP